MSCAACSERRANMFKNFTDWIKEPFRSDMDTLHWFLFLGLLIVLMGFWRIILRHITEGL
jgi:hypothetical protein